MQAKGLIHVKQLHIAVCAEALLAAAPGSLGSRLAALSAPALAPSTDYAAGTSADARPSDQAPEHDDADAHGCVDIPLLKDDVDLACFLRVDLDSDVRAIARFMHAQGLPAYESQQAELLAPAVFCHRTLAEDPESERGACGFVMEHQPHVFLSKEIGTSS